MSARASLPRNTGGPGPRGRAVSWYRRAAAVLLIAPTALAVSGFAVPTALPSTTKNHTVDVNALDDFVLKSLEHAAIPGAAIAITQGEEVLHLRGYGMDSRRQPVTAQTPFRIASLSKAFTSLAVMQLVDAGRLSLQDTVSARLPEFHIADPRGAAITVRQLLNQTSGLADRAVPDLSRPQPSTPAQATISLRGAHLVANPGTEFNYHNPNYQIAARLVEVVSGESFEHYMRVHVFVPAAMDDTDTTTRDNDPAPRLADGHVVVFGRPVPMPAPGDFVAGNGGVVSTAQDLAQWLIVQARGGLTSNGTRLVSNESMTEMHTNRGPGSYALGWAVHAPANHPRRLEHTGNLLTFSAGTAIYPETGIGVTLLFNSSSGLLLEQNALFYDVLKIIEGEHPIPGTAQATVKLLDALFVALALTAAVLGIRAIRKSRPWARKRRASPARILAGVLPPLAALVTVGSLPALTGRLIGGRDLTWVSIAYGWPSLVTAAIIMAIAAAGSLTAQTWHLIRQARPAAIPPTPGRGRNRAET